jgi:sugar (pentulose or hexulose) kinase
VRARGQLSGLSTATSKADLVMAVCESVAYAARHCIEAAGLTGRVSVCGGGSNSQTWSQMAADILQRPLHVARRPEVGARGAAIAAMDAAGIAYDPEEWTASEGVIEPRRDTASQYEAGFARYLDSVAAARSLWNRDP